ncbi:MAG: protein phosphatase 2C domain-containing protein [Ornithinimicrobium sp.]
MSIALAYAARSHIGLGTKSRNEDSAYAGPELLVLCDGMGGHAAGDVASSLIVGELVHLDGEADGADDMLDVLNDSITAANERLAEVSQESADSSGMGTTCIAMLRSGSKLAVANIGDSRAYLRRGTRVTQITRDHSFVQQLLDEGRISAEEAVHHPQRSLVTRVLTGRDDDHPDLTVRELRAGDRLLVCSDGVTDYVAEDTVADILRATGSPGDIADQLIAISLRAAARDNITVIVADAIDADGNTDPQVVGAASERRGMQMLEGDSNAASPAAKAAALSRHTRDEPEAPMLAEENNSGLLAWLRRGVVALAAVAVIGAAGYGTYLWSQQQYFVGESGGNVTIYRGVAQDLGPLALSEPEVVTDLAVDELPEYYQERVTSTLSADDLEDAENTVSELRGLILIDCTPIPVIPPDIGTSGDRTLPVPEGTVPPQSELETVLPPGCES